ncbi:MAG: hypothetical protein ACK5AR_10410 [Flavobacteriia bacterium]
METAKSMTIEQAFYLLKHFTEIDSAAKSLFLAHGFKEDAISQQLQTIGSKFFNSFCQSPFDLETQLKRTKPIEQIIQSNGRIAQVYQFDQEIGTEQVIEKEKIDPEKLIDLERNGILIQAVQLQELPKTNCIVVIKSKEDAWITAFPGKYAPAFPSDWMTIKELEESHDYWANHVFIKP